MAGKKGFTLIELLVVIAIIALLIAILVPALTKVKQKAGAIICMTNTKNLSLGWYIYQEENDSYIMSANMGGYTIEGNRTPGWINTPYNTTPGDRQCKGTTIVTDEDEINGIMDGALWDYVEDPDAYNCPSDKVKSQYDGTEKFVTSAIPGSLAGSNSGSDKQVIKLTRMASPGTRYNFVETAEERNWNMNGRFVIGAPEYTGDSQFCWWGPMAVNHGNSSTLGYCDGHASNHKWVDPFTIERVTKLSQQSAEWYDVECPPDDQRTDIEFMADGWPFDYKI